MTFLDTLFNRTDPREAMAPLYRAIVAEARQPVYYLAGVPDTREGRFDMVVALLALTLLRLEHDEGQRQNSVFLTELFVDDMDGQLRQFGIGDMLIGKHVGRLVSALGGRIGAYRDATQDRQTWDEVVARNLFGMDEREDGDRNPAIPQVSNLLRQFYAALVETPTDQIISGDIPTLAQ